MKIGILCSEPVPVQKDIIGTGAGLRALQLGNHLSSWAEIIYIVPEKKGIVYFFPGVHTYPEGQRGLEEYIPSVDILIAVQWPVVNLLKEKPSVPLIIDFLSPLMLENQFLPTYHQKTFLSTKIEALRKADLFFTSTPRQTAYFLPWLSLAGFNLADKDIVREVPLVFQDLSPVKFQKNKPLTFVHTGYFWPWQKTVPYLEILADIAEKKGDSLVIYGGRHPYWTTFSGKYYDVSSLLERPNVTLKEPVPFSSLDEELGENCIGVDLCAPNYERFLASPIKLSLYLAKKMPVLVSSVYAHSQTRWKKCGWSLYTAHIPSYKRLLRRIYPSIRRSYKAKSGKIFSEQKYMNKQVSVVLHEKEFKKIKQAPPQNDAFFDFLPDYARLKFEYAEMENRVKSNGIFSQLKSAVKSLISKE